MHKKKRLTKNAGETVWNWSLVKTFLSLPSPVSFCLSLIPRYLPSPPAVSDSWAAHHAVAPGTVIRTWSCSLPQQFDFKYRCPGFPVVICLLVQQKTGLLHFLPAHPWWQRWRKNPSIWMGHPVGQFPFALCRNITSLLLALFSSTIVFSIPETLRKIFCWHFARETMIF